MASRGVIAGVITGFCTLALGYVKRLTLTRGYALDARRFNASLARVATICP